MGLPQPVGEAFPLEGVSLRPLLGEPSLELCVHIQHPVLLWSRR